MNVQNKPFGMMRVWLVCLAVSVALFATTLGNGYTLDDHVVVEKRAELRQPSAFFRIMAEPWWPDSPDTGIYRPLTLVSFWASFLLSGATAPLHAVNIALHALNAALLVYLVRMISRPRVAWYAGVLFLFLPIHVEPVASIVGRADLLSACSMLAALCLLFRKNYAWSGAAFFLGLVSKEFALVMLPVAGLLLLIEYRAIVPALRTWLYFVVPAGVYFMLRWLVLGTYAFGHLSFDPVTAPMAYLHFPVKLFTGFSNIGRYVVASVYPATLSPDYSFSQIAPVTNPLGSPLALLGILLVVGSAVALFRSDRRLQIPSAIFLCSALFVSNGWFTTSGSFAERWWYFPSISLVMVVALGVDRISGGLDPTSILRWGLKKNIALGLVFSVIFSWYGYRIVRTSAMWHNDRTLIFAAARLSPRSAWARANLANLYLAERNYAAAGQEAEAAVARYPGYSFAENILGKLAWKNGDLSGARLHYQHAAHYERYGRNLRSIYRSLAFLSLDEGNVAQAVDYFEKAMQAPIRGDGRDIQAIDRVLGAYLRDAARRTRPPTVSERAALDHMISLVRGI